MTRILCLLTFSALFALPGLALAQSPVESTFALRAEGFADNAAATATLESITANLGRCYASSGEAHGHSFQFQLSVDGKGHVGSVQSVRPSHATVAACLSTGLGSVQFGPQSNPQTMATVTVVKTDVPTGSSSTGATGATLQSKPPGARKASPSQPPSSKAASSAKKTAPKTKSGK